MSKKLELEINNFIECTHDNWKEILLNCIHENHEDSDTNDGVEEAFVNLIYAMREILITDDKAALEYIKEKFNNELTVYNELVKYTKDLLASYYSFASLRLYESEHPTKIHKIIDYIFDELILRYNPDFSMGYKKFGFRKKDDFTDAALALSTLVEYVVKKNYTRTTIDNMFQEISRLNKQNISYITEKIEQNIRDLQLVMILKNYDEWED